MLWPSPEGSAPGAPADNPWLTGSALDGSPGSGASSGPGLDPQSPGATGGAGAGGPGGGAQGSGAQATASGGADSSPSPSPEPARLLFRAYVESGGSFKGLLIEHVAGGPSPACSVDLYSNGSTEVWRSLAVPAGLELGERVILCIPDGASTACSVGFGGSVYNGNDALVLRCAEEPKDAIGVLGNDPGKGWVGPGYDGQPISTVDAGLWRCATGGDQSDAAFDSTQWISWDWGSDPSWQGPVCPEPPPGLAGSGGL